VQDFVTAIGLMFAIEGILLAAFPEKMRQAMATMATSPDQFLRYSGLIAAVLGVLFVFFGRML
jgi:uncharacterized protein